MKKITWFTWFTTGITCALTVWVTNYTVYVLEGSLADVIVYCFCIGGCMGLLNMGLHELWYWWRGGNREKPPAVESGGSEKPPKTVSRWF